MNEKVKTLVTSRRFIVLLGGMVVVFSEQLFGTKLNEEQIIAVLTIVSSWILGDSLRKTE